MLEEKALGTGQYADDIHMDGMIYAKALRSKYPRARVDRVDVSKALEHPKCVTALTAKMFHSIRLVTWYRTGMCL